MTRRGLFIRWAAGLVLMASAGWWVLAPPRSWAEDRKPTEYQVKAAYLYNFAKFAEWPAGTVSDPSAPIIFGILGEDPFGGYLDAVTSRSINNRKIQIKRYHDVSEIKTCQVLFIGASEREHVEEIVKILRRSGTLLIGDMEGFAVRGGMIGFIVTGKTVGFEINVDAVARAGITLHSRLLNMAVIVQEDTSTEGE